MQLKPCMLQVCKVAKMDQAVALELKARHLGLCQCGGDSTKAVLARNEIATEMFVVRSVFTSHFPVPVASVDTRTSIEVQTSVQEAHVQQQV